MFIFIYKMIENKDEVQTVGLTMNAVSFYSGHCFY